MLSLLIAYLVIVITLLGIWIVFLVSRNSSWLDGCWSIAILLAALSYGYSQASSALSWWPLLLVAVWAFRLSGFLYWTRIRHRYEDPRYQKLGWQLNTPLGFLLISQFQGILAWLNALPFYWLTRVAEFQTPQAFGSLLVVLGVLFESIADWQLHHAKQTAKGTLLTSGIWSWSRHPNYFFEFLVWYGFCWLALQEPGSIVSVLSPAVLLYGFVRYSIPLSEQQSRKRHSQAYARYQAQTSVLFPAPMPLTLWQNVTLFVVLLLVLLAMWWCRI